MIARYLALAVVAGLMSFGAYAQQNLAGLVEEAKAEWMFGQWETKDENGDPIALNVSWDLAKHVAVLHVKTSEMESKGFSAIDPSSGEVKYLSFDTRGSIGKGGWSMESDELVLRLELQRPDREPMKMGFVFTGNPTDGLVIRSYALNSDGELDSTPRQTYKFKKVKTASAAK